MGRQPKFLPPLEEGPAENYENRSQEIKAAHRLREIATDSIIRETARQRLVTADKHTAPSSQLSDYNLGDMVD